MAIGPAVSRPQRSLFARRSDRTAQINRNMCDFLAADGLKSRLVPGPSTERGHALPLRAHPKEPKLCYAFGKYVVVRSLEDAGDNFVYRGHKYPVGACAFAPNGYWVASGDSAGFLRVWSWDNPDHILKVEVQVFSGAIKDLQWDGESKRIAVVGDGATLRCKCVMWDTGNGIGEMVGHQKKVITVAYRQQRPFRIMTGSEDFKCVFYKGPPFKLDHSCTEHGNYVNCVCYAPDGATVASVGSDKKVVIYEGKEGATLRTLADAKKGPQGSVYSCAYAPDGSKLLTGGADKRLCVWNVDTGALLSSTDMGKDVADMQMGVAWAATGRPLSLSLSGDLNYLDVGAAGCSATKVVQAPQAPISAMTTLRDGTIVAGCNDGTVFSSGDGKEWTKIAGAVPRSICRAAHGGKVTSVVGLATGFASGGFDDKVRFGDAGAYSAEVAVEGQPVALGSLGDVAACATTKGVCVLDAAGVKAFQATAYDPTACAADPTKDRFAVGAKDGSIRIFDRTLTEVSSLPPHRGAVAALAWSPDGLKLAAGDADREIKVYLAREGFKVAVQNTWRHHTARVTAVAWDPSSKCLASTSNDETIYYWSLDAPAKHVRKYELAHKDGGVALAFKGATLVSAGHDGCACLWDV
mmetsp:Transcript_2155/g.6584  ORF Transcript_2155/g.6584 Transcript_2155/m.6584 type:complete len:636 (+) Transcript_2155:548-2455(+)